MCGIVGEWRLDGGAVSVEQLVDARDLLTHRGPDAAGLHVDGPVGFGHRRLSVIDLSPAGQMPMFNASRSIWSVFNGEIYNFRQLRGELEGLGYRFQSHSDGEVLVHGYEAWGRDLFARLDGMFAVALWDARTRELILARDPLGEKPLYYFHRPGRALLFASTLSPLLRFKEVACDIDPEALRAYASFGFVDAPHSIVKGVRKVRPGTSLVFKQDREPLESEYWSLERVVAEARPAPASIEQATDDLNELLREAVRSRLVSDVPLGAFLSGGVDSSLVVALMAEINPGSIRTFTIGFHEKDYDESEYAHRVAKHLGVENTMMVLSARDVLAELPSVTEYFDEPMADFSVLPSLAVARLARRHVTVALTGDGADEAFGGYRYYAGTRFFDEVAGSLPAFARAGIARGAGLIPFPRARRALRRATVDDAASYFGYSGFYRGATAQNGLPQILAKNGHAAPQDIVANYVRSLANLDATEAGMVWDATRTLPGAWLAKVDRSSMAVALETRAPFLARSVFEYAFRLPLDYRVRGIEKKILLRRVLSRYLPKELVDRPKHGFTAPLKHWFAHELRDELHDRLAPSRVQRFGLFEPLGVQAVLREQMQGSADHTQLLWALFHLDRWFERYAEKSH